VLPVVLMANPLCFFFCLHMLVDHMTRARTGFYPTHNIGVIEPPITDEYSVTHQLVLLSRVFLVPSKEIIINLFLYPFPIFIALYQSHAWFSKKVRYLLSYPDFGDLFLVVSTT
jgi:hypothetical protein